MVDIAYFGHDAADAAIRRRVKAFQADGIAVTGFMMRRADDVTPDWCNIDLGLTRDGAFAQRVRAIFAGASHAAEARETLAAADLIVARNLDMLACAFLAKRKTGLKTPVVYECLDVHRLLTRGDPVGLAARALERSLLSRCAGLIVSSPGFLRHHFEPRHHERYTAHLLENRMTAGDAYGPRPAAPDLAENRSLRLGWFGVLRCQRSFSALMALADLYGPRLEIVLRGAPARNEIAVFEPEIDKRPNVTFHGRYTAPGDLAAIYAGVDVVWAGDYMEAGANSVWLLPNRLYEGGYFATPPIAPAGTQTNAWAETRGVGFTMPEPVETGLAEIVGELLDDPARIAEKARVLLSLDESAFIQPPGEMARLVTAVLEGDDTP